MLIRAVVFLPIHLVLQVNTAVLIIFVILALNRFCLLDAPLEIPIAELIKNASTIFVS